MSQTENSKPLIVYAFLGFTGGVGQLYPGMTELVKKIEDKGVPVKLWTWRQGEKAADHCTLYDDQNRVVVIGHSRGAAAGWRMIQCMRPYATAFFPIDYIPTNTVDNVASFFLTLAGRKNPPVCLPRRIVGELIAFRQENFVLYDPKTWPQGREFIDEDGAPYERQYRIAAFHTTIDGSQAVHQLIIDRIMALR